MKKPMRRRLRIKSVEPVGELRLRLTLMDGTAVHRAFTRRSFLAGPIGRKALAAFDRVQVEGGALTWPGGYDVCQDFAIWGDRHFDHARGDVPEPELVLDSGGRSRRPDARITRPRVRPRVVALLVTYSETDGWVAVSVLGLKGAHTQGKTWEEARRNALDVIGVMLEEAPHQLVGITRRTRIPPGALVERVFVVVSL